jgi:hypothetical protein
MMVNKYNLHNSALHQVDELPIRNGSLNGAQQIRRGAQYYLQNEGMKNLNSGYQVRLPKLSNQNRLNHENYLRDMRNRAHQQQLSGRQMGADLPQMIAGQGLGSQAALPIMGHKDRISYAQNVY